MKRIIAIIGAGGFGREVAHYVNDMGKIWDKVYFIDDNIEAETLIDGIPVIGKIEEAALEKTDFEVVCAVGNPKVKKELVDRANKAGLTFTNIIHPTAYITPTVMIGTGNIISPYCVLTSNVTIGNHVALNPQCGLGHDSVIKDFNSLYWNVNISGNVTVEEGCEIGSNAVVIQGKTVGKWSIIGAGSVVTDSLPENCTAVGIPAKIILKKTDEFFY